MTKCSRPHVNDWSRLSRYLLYICAFLSGNFLAPQSPARADAELATVSDSLLREIAQSEEWLRLLYYGHTWFEGRKGLIDSDGFYLSGSKTDALAELKETIKAFSLPPDAVDDEDDHPRCIFSARFRYFKKVLPEFIDSLPEVACPDLDEYISMWNPQSLTLIFSDYFINNPVSMFGHVFLRFNGDPERSRMLDLAVSFAAQPAIANSIYMALTGPIGGMPGLFFADPYYTKFQQYSNHEGRDLWEYELNLSQEEVINVFYSLWEVGKHRVDYYYLDDNCALLLLFVLETARPDLEFTKSLQGIVTPVDSVKVVLSSSPIIKTISYRPSSASRFKKRYAQLNTLPERRAFEEIARLEGELEGQLIQSGEKDLLQTRLKEVLETLESEQGRSEVLDALLEYGDHKHKLALGKTLEESGAQAYRQTVLIARSQLKHPPSALEKPSDRPDLGHDTFRIGLLGGLKSLELGSEFEDHFILSIRPAMRDLKSPTVGYPDDFAIEFLETEVTFEGIAQRAKKSGSNVFIQSFKLFESNSRPNLFTPLRSPTWNIKLAYERLPCVAVGLQSASCAISFLDLGLGITWSAANRWGAQISFLPARLSLGVLHTSSALNATPFAAFSPALALGYSPAQDLKLTLEGDLEARWLFPELERLLRQDLQPRCRFTAAYRLSRNQETRLGAEASRHSAQFNLGFYQYL